MTEKLPDWTAIENDYRAGLKPLRVIASENGLTEGAIRKRAKREEWERDLAAKIQSKAEALVRKDLVRKEVRKLGSADEKAVIDANAFTVAQVRLTQRKDISRGRALVMRLFDELEFTTEHTKLQEMMKAALESGDVDQMNSISSRINSLSGRASTMKTLADSLKTLVGLEREAYGIFDKDPNSKDPIPTVFNMKF